MPLVTRQVGGQTRPLGDAVMEITDNCQNEDLLGNVVSIAQPGQYSTRALESFGYVNDQASGFFLKPGHRAILYSNAGFSGASVTITAGDTNTYWCAPGGMQDDMSSIVIEHV
ncbi:hypothetical protein HDV00_001031 [Rhizophlyctis rosea]|nr:hypothetical protein HDV00_001031 [Rhizophlyctis rosea]